MSDNEIRMLLDTMANDVNDVRPLERSALRRARTRRMAVAVTAVASVISIVVGGTGLALSAGGSDGAIAPASPGETPPPPNPMPGYAVAYGTTDDGDEWWLSAYENDAGELCTDLQHDDGRIIEDCTPYGPEEVGFLDDDAEVNSVFGWVPEDTKGLWVTWPDEYEEETTPEDDELEDEEEGSFEEDSDEGETAASEETTAEPGTEGEPGPNIDISFEGEEEVALIEAPEGFPFPVRFYVIVPAPHHAEVLRIELVNGDVSVLVVARDYHLVCNVDPVEDGELTFQPEPNEEACVERRRGE